MDLTTYRHKIEEQLEQTETGFRSHLGAFVGVNAGLAAVWYFTGGGFPWFLIPLFGWGIGVATNYDELLRKRQEVSELRRLGHLNKDELDSYKKLSKARAGWRGHLVSTVATSALLFVINMITSPSFPWFLFPTGGMAIGLFTHYPAYKRKARKWRRALGLGGSGAVTGPREGVEGPSLSGKADPTDAPAAAREIKSQILFEAADHEGLPPGEIEALLNDYLGRLAMLEERREELASLRSSLDGEETKRQIERLTARLGEIESENHRQEYQASIDQLRRQLEMDSELGRDLELIELRLTSALSSLRQLRVELARSKGQADLGRLESMEELRRRSQDLQEYLGDLRQAYDDLKQ
jgi:hypothetical protein